LSGEIVNWIASILLSDDVLLLLVMFGALGLIERRWPAVPAPAGRVAFDFRYAVVLVVVVAIGMPFITAAIASLARRFGDGLIDLRPYDIGGVGGAAIAVLISALFTDFLFYWYHRFEHRNQVLWQTHLLHHCDEHVSAATAARSHIIEFLMVQVFVTLPMAILFKLPAVTVALLALIPAAWTYFSHANIRLGFGPLWWLLVSPNYHRIHHSLEPQHLDRNFALWFPLWDILFGTVWRPGADEVPAVGVAGVHVVSFAQAIALPFTGWKKMLKDARAKPRDLHSST
jgi:sterol desaturase/sphingolipid hydroxylase (fatty acid hydroxylase superfamily)